MAHEKAVPTWRDFAGWSAVGAVFYLLLVGAPSRSCIRTRSIR